MMTLAFQFSACNILFALNYKVCIVTKLSSHIYAIVLGLVENWPNHAVLLCKLQIAKPVSSKSCVHCQQFCWRRLNTICAVDHIHIAAAIRLWQRRLNAYNYGSRWIFWTTLAL